MTAASNKRKASTAMTGPAMVGIVMYGTLALLPALLQNLMNYPVVTTGLVTAPRGFGGLFVLLLLSRINTPLDPRLMIAAGFGCVALSAWQMTHFDLQMSEATVMWSGIAQGIGSGLIFVPLASATLPTATEDVAPAIFAVE